MKNYRSAIYGVLIIFIFIPLKNLSTQNIQLIQDAEIENTLLEWILPIYEVAGLSSNSVKIYIINDEQINAFVAGGQNIFIRTGLILNASEPDAIIGVMAHEIGHIAGGHLIRTYSAQEQATTTAVVGTIITLGLLAMGKVMDLDIKDGTNLATIGPTIAQRSFFKHSRENEKTADISAIKYLLAVQRPIEPLIKLLKIIGKKELLHENRQDPYLRTHPFVKDRVEILESSGVNKFTKNFKEKIQYERMVAKIIAFTKSPGKTLLLYPSENGSLVNSYARAIAYFKMPDLEKGLKEINALIKNNPEDPYFPELLGQMLFENGEIEKAIEALELSSKLLPTEPNIMLALANAQMEAEKKHLTLKARKNLNEIIKIAPDKIFAWRLLSIAEERLGNRGNANLAAAEEAYRSGKFKLAIIFAEKARKNFNKGAPNDLRAEDIIFFAERNIK